MKPGARSQNPMTESMKHSYPKEKKKILWKNIDDKKIK